MPALDWNATFFLVLGAALLLGVGAGHFIGRRVARGDRERAEQLGREVDEMREELESGRDEIARHFQQTSHLFRDLTERYTRLYTHLADGARQFSTDEVPILPEAFEAPRLASAEPPADEVPEVRPDPTNGGAPGASI